MARVIGIDLGTTNSCVAIMDGGKPRVIENSEGDRTTPSIVAFTKDDEVLVGQSAKRQAVTNPQNTLYAIKRLIGRRYDDKVVQKDVEMVPYKIVKADNGDAWVEVHGKKMAPPEIAARVLMKMKKTAEDYLGEPVTEAVITVPAYFNDSQRQATKDAGQIAGLTVKRIINEPTAAALAYGLDKSGGDRKVAVYDLGGGTFDISIIEFADVDGERQFEVLATNGDTFLGGEDFDKRVIDYLAAEFQKESGVDVRRDPLAMQRLKEAAEKAKIELSSSQQTEVNLPYITADASGPEAPRDEAHPREARVAGRGPRAEDHRALPHRAQGRGPVHERRRRGDPRGRPDAHAAGAEGRQGLLRQGAAQGRQPGRGRGRRRRRAGGRADGRGQGRAAARRHPAVARHRDARRRDDQADREEHHDPDQGDPGVLDGRRQPDGRHHPRAAGRARPRRRQQVARPLRPLGHPAGAARLPQVEVTFDIDANGILNVSAKDKATAKEQKIVIKASSGLTDDEIKRMVRDAEAHAEEDKKFRELAETRNRADALLHATEKALKDLGDKVSPEDRAKTESALSDLRAVLKGDDKDVIETKARAVAEASAAIAQQAYASQQSAGPGGPGAGSGPAGGPGGKDDVLDAEFEEVKDKDGKAS